MSSGSPTRPTGIRASSWALGPSGSSRKGAVAEVRVMPGAMVLTRMRCGAPAAHRCLLIASTPPLAAPCGTIGMNGAPRTAATEATLRTAPPPRAIRCGQAACVQK